MKKPKYITILTLAALGALYGSTTASASPFRIWFQDVVAQGAATVKQFVASTGNREFALKPGETISTGPTFIPIVDVVTAIQAFVQRDQADVSADPNAHPGDAATGALTDRDLGASPFNPGTLLRAVSAPLAQAYDSSSDSRARFVFQDGSEFPGASHRGRGSAKKATDRNGEKDPPDGQDTEGSAPLGTPVVVDTDAPIVETPLENLIPLPKHDDVGQAKAGPHGEDFPPLVVSDIGAPFNPAQGLRGIGDSGIIGRAQVIPEPVTLALLGLGLVGLGLNRSRRA